MDNIFSTINNCIQLASSTLELKDTIETITTLNEIYGLIGDVYQNTLDGFLESTNQALLAASVNEGNRNIEINNAINNLRNAFNICEKALNKKIFTGFSLFKQKKFLISDRKKFMEMLIKVSVNIVGLYNYQGDKFNKKIWSEKSVNLYRQYINSYYTISEEQLYYINSEFAVEKKHFNRLRKFVKFAGFAYDSCWDYSYDETEFYYYTYKITSKGKEYIEKQKEKLMEDFINKVNCTIFAFSKNVEGLKNPLP